MSLKQSDLMDASPGTHLFIDTNQQLEAEIEWDGGNICAHRTAAANSGTSQVSDDIDYYYFYHFTPTGLMDWFSIDASFIVEIVPTWASNSSARQVRGNICRYETTLPCNLHLSHPLRTCYEPDTDRLIVYDPAFQSEADVCLCLNSHFSLLLAEGKIIGGVLESFRDRIFPDGEKVAVENDSDVLFYIEYLVLISADKLPIKRMEQLARQLRSAAPTSMVSLLRQLYEDEIEGYYEYFGGSPADQQR